MKLGSLTELAKMNSVHGNEQSWQRCILLTEVRIIGEMSNAGGMRSDGRVGKDEQEELK